MNTNVSTIFFGIVNVLMCIFIILLFVKAASFLSNYKKDKKDMELKLNELSTRLDEIQNGR